MSVWAWTKAAEPREFQSQHSGAVVEFSWLFPTVYCSGWVWLTPTLENQWLDADKILPAAFLSDTHQELLRRQNSQFFVKPGLNQACRRRLKWKQCRVPFPLFSQIRGRRAFLGGIWDICDTFNFVAYCLNRLWCWRGENGELESKFVNSCLSLLPSPRQGQTTLVAQKDSLPHISRDISVYKSQCLFLFANVNDSMLFREG